ncbi:MAG: NifB/NifX family molybdenum-iron cluster-binding protein [Dehalococcoidia bacterium]|nr:NifB/NifX family molybdenum-iron cluster-binding protein [Dehalococcoidia bacterium]
MRYAIPVSSGLLAQHFGHCDQFALIDVDIRARQVLEKKVVPSPGHQPGLLPQWLAEQGVSIVIAGGMGMRAQDLFRENRIQVVVGSLEQDPEKAVLSHLNGVLDTGDNVCDH